MTSEGNKRTTSIPQLRLPFWFEKARKRDSVSVRTGSNPKQAQP